MGSMRSMRRLAFGLGLSVFGVALVGCDDGEIGDGEGTGGSGTTSSTSASGNPSGNGPSSGSAGGEDDTSSSSSNSGGSDGSGGGGAGIPEGMAMVRIVHASCDAPAVDVWTGGQKIVDGAVYGAASAWLEVPAGAYDIQIKASPSSEADAAVYEVLGLELADGTKTSAIAAGLLASTEVADKFRVLAVEEDFSPAGSDNAIVRVIHASPDAPTVGIDFHDDDASSPELSNLDRFGTTAIEGFPLTADTALQIGIAASGSRVTAFTTPNLPEGAELLVIATGLVGRRADDAQGFSLLAIGPEGAIGFIDQNPTVYALHASPDAPAVDLYAGAAKLTSLSFGQLSAPLQVPPGDYAIDFRAAGADPASSPAATSQTGTLVAGQRYLSVATGFLGGSGEQAFRLAGYVEQFDRATASEARVRFVHASPDAPTVDLGILNVEAVVNPVLAAGLSFSEASTEAGTSVGTGQIPIGVTPAGQNDQVVASFHAQTVAGVRAFGLAAGALAPESESTASFRLLVVDTSPTPWTVSTVHPQP
jgi:hypothetical protein